jgi:rhodanese-related sulfurtransferase
VVVYCERGGRAGQAAEVLLDAGYGSVLYLEGDMSEWRAKEHPTASP